MQNLFGKQSASIGDIVRKKAAIAVSFVFLAIILEYLTYFLIFWTVGFFQYPWIDFLTIFIIGVVIFFLPFYGLEIGVSMFFLLAQCILCLINKPMFYYSGTVGTLSYLQVLGELGGVFTDDFVNPKVVLVLAVFWVGSLVWMCLIARFLSAKGTLSQQTLLLLLGACSTLGQALYTAKTVLISTLPTGQTVVESVQWLYERQYSDIGAYRAFGTYGFYMRHLEIAAEDKLSLGNTEELDELFASSPMASESAPAYFGALSGKNVVLVLMESVEWSVINAEYTPTLYAMASQGLSFPNFYGRNKTNISEELTILGSYHASRAVSALKSEALPFSLPNSLKKAGYQTAYFHPSEGDFYGRDKIMTPIFGFEQSYFLEQMDFLPGHTSKKGFYQLDSDSAMIKGMLDQMSATDRPFYSQIMTLTTHGDYTDLDSCRGAQREGTTCIGKDYTDMTAEERAEFEKNALVKCLFPYYNIITSYPKTFVEGTPTISAANDAGHKWLRYKQFQAGASDLDVGINALVADLQKKGTLEDTVFVFLADHSSYFSKMNYYCKDLDSTVDLSNAPTIYNIPFFIWCGSGMNLQTGTLPVEGYRAISFRGKEEGLSSGRIDKFTNTLDVLPTLYELLGYDYNTGLFLGKSVFDEEESIFRSAEAGVFDDECYFDGTYVIKDGVSYSLSAPEVSSFVAKLDAYYQKANALELIYYKNYFADRDIAEEGILLQKDS